MKVATTLFVIFLLYSCNVGIDESNQEKRKTPSITMQDRIPKGVSVNGDGAPPKTTIHKISLVCRDMGEDESGVPRYDVYAKWDSTQRKIGSCNACAPLDIQDYHEYGIPNEAVAAVGGWFAGGGDYFYAVRTEDDGAIVYAGWQEEGQIEQNDSSYHYKIVLEKHP